MSGPEKVTISQLSEEILVHIFSFLLPSDRRNCALICRRWAEALGAPALTREIWFHVKGSDMEQAATILHRSYRQYKNLRLSDGSLFHFNSSFWTEVGVSLRKLELIECFWSPDVYYDILQECPNLESLTICSSKRLLTRLNFELPPWVTLRRTQDAMRNVHHLHVKFLLNADMLWLLLVPLTNVKTIALSRFDRNSDFLLRLRDIVGENRKITMLDLEMPFLRFDDCERVLQICAPSVQEIRARRDILPREVFEAMRLCTKLRHLTLQMNLELENNSLRRVLQNVPELETLELCDESKLSQITQETLAGVLELTKLRELILRLGRHRGQNARDMTQFLNDLERISTLEHISLDMDGFAVTETAFRSLTNLPKLQTLALHNIKWNGECPKILSTPKHLETLRVTGRTNRRGCYNPALKHTAMMSFRSDLRTRTEMSALVSLKFENLPVTYSDLESITANHDRVRVLFLWNCANVTAVELTRAVQRLPLLEELEVRGRKVIGGEIFDALEKGCHQLKSFRLSHYIGFDRSAAELFKLRRPMVVLGCNGESVDLVLPFIEHSF